MKFRTLIAIAAAAAASAVAWKMVKDARREEDDITLELAGDGTPDAQEAETQESGTGPAAPEAQDARDAQEEEAAPAEEAPAVETAAPQRPIDPTTIASVEDFSGDWEDIGCKS